MKDTLYRLVYYSRNKIVGSPEEILKEIHHILDAARRNNPQVDVTGALLFNSKGFAQVLEGPLGNVECVFEKIQQDPRHGEVCLLEIVPVSGRTFPDWSMAFVGGIAKDTARYEEIAGESGYDPSHMTGEAILRTLHRLVIEEEYAAF